MCAKRTARAIPLVAQLDAAFSLLQQLIRIFAYARMELLSLLLALGASIFLRALCPDGSGKKCSYTMLFLVPAVVLKLFTLLFFSVKL